MTIAGFDEVFGSTMAEDLIDEYAGAGNAQTGYEIHTPGEFDADCQLLAVDKADDWGDGHTTYTFPDGSRVRVSGGFAIELKGGETV